MIVSSAARSSSGATGPVIRSIDRARSPCVLSHAAYSARWYGDAANARPVAGIAFLGWCVTASSDAGWPHVGPHLLDVVQTSRLRAFGSLRTPPGGQLLIGRPDGVLLLIVEYHHIADFA